MEKNPLKESSLDFCKPFELRDAGWYILGGGILLLLFIVIFLWIKRKKNRVEQPVETQKVEYEIQHVVTEPMPAKQGNRMDSKPRIQLLKQKRSFLQYILLSVVTCSLYHYWFMDSLVKDVNAICKKDGQDTVGVGRMIGFSILTFGVYQYLWLAEIVDRVYDSADEYDVEIRQDSESFFIWMILVPFIGYFIAMHRFVSDVNQLAAEYEKRRHFVKCTSPITQRSLSSGRGTLIGLVGSLAGQTIELKPGQRIKIGRSAAEASVIVNSEKISRVHCLVQYNGNQLGYTVTDLSRNGVVVNGKRILYSVPTYVPSESVLSLADGANKFQLT